MAKSASKFSFLDVLQEGILEIAEAGKNGTVKIKRSDLKALIEKAFQQGVKAAAGGERVKFPVVGTLLRKDVEAKKGGKGRNPFTGEEIMIKPRPATKKPRWSFPKSIKEDFANKKNW
ncbi:MAG TPA: HU family DNA-binding protein [Leptospiraceae bacterium]|jgi:nucleoid DNA-binding protein|nr:HU family DNA-binding protein [Leptospiraceae bacterium]